MSDMIDRGRETLSQRFTESNFIPFKLRPLCSSLSLNAWQICVCCLNYPVYMGTNIMWSGIFHY
eukprot:XP_001706131.1 Hypothetical protein GL50803_4803 [Giardia lamblia ATCC 50803]